VRPHCRVALAWCLSLAALSGCGSGSVNQQPQGPKVPAVSASPDAAHAACLEALKEDYLVSRTAGSNPNQGVPQACVDISYKDYLALAAQAAVAVELAHP
jgi:hypothetical protein